MEFFFQLLIILLATKLAGDLTVRLGMPGVIGKLLIGIVIGPAVLGWIQDTVLIDQLSEIGVLLLMFLAGLETDLDELNRSRRSSFMVALGGIILPLIGGYLTGSMLGFSTIPALFLGVLLSATSVSITVQTLREMNKLQSRESVTILGAAIVDDILVVIILAFLMSFAGTGGDASLGIIIAKKVLFFVLIFFAGWKLVPWVLRLLSSLRVTESLISAGLIICFGFAYFAEMMGVAGIIGAFAAGVAISQTKYKHETEDRLTSIAFAVFVPIFFVSIGISVSFQGIQNQIWFIILLTVIAVLTKLIGCGLGARFTGFNTHSSIVIGSGMVSRGEVALIIATIGLQAGLLSKDYYTSSILVIILTTLIAPVMLKLIFGKEPKTTN